MIKASNLAALVLLAGIAANTVNAADSVAQQAGTTVATVDGVAIPQTRLELRLKSAEQQGQADGPELRKAVRDNLINLEVLAQAASKNSALMQQEETAQQLELARQSVLVEAYLQGYAKSHPISEEALKQEYENLKKRVGSKEYKVAHILVASEAEAQAIIASLNKKVKFETLAKQKSNDPGSKNQGGELGWSVPSNFVPPFAQAIVALNKGQVSAPVQTQFGWHVIKLDDTRELKVPGLEEVRANIEKRLQQQQIQEHIKALRANAVIK